MDEKKMYQGIRRLTLTLALVVAVAMACITKELKFTIAGVFIGALTGIMGFQMIVNMSEKIDGSNIDMKLPAFKAYSKRYFLYALIFGISAMVGVDILALLVGFICHKAAIIVYVWLHRKEAE